jgi:glycerol kinase
MLPQIKNTSDDFGFIERDGSIIPITAMVGDQQSALFGQNCFEKGQVKNTYGTGCFMLMNTGDQPFFSKKGLLTTVAWKLGDKTTYAIEGSVFIAGASVQWLRDQMDIIRTAPESENYAHQAKEDVYFVPAFVGLGTPHWDSRVRGSIFGITRATTKYDVVRATLQAIAFQTKDVLDVMKEETGIAIPRLWVDGGASANQYLMQFQSDILHTPIYLPEVLETTSMGAAYLAGLSIQFFRGIAHIGTIKKIKRIYSPKMKANDVEKRCAKWRLAIEAARVFKD